jgi:hypothetical protein
LTKKIKITIEYPDIGGDVQTVESEYPANRKELLGNLLSMIGKFDSQDVTYGFIFLKGEPHESGAFISTVEVKVSPRLPKADDFKKMLVDKIGFIWKEHMRWSAADKNVAYTPYAGKEDSMLDYTCKGKF